MIRRSVLNRRLTDDGDNSSAIALSQSSTSSARRFLSFALPSPGMIHRSAWKRSWASVDGANWRVPSARKSRAARATVYLPPRSIPLS
jgi:hypothetical protein